MRKANEFGWFPFFRPMHQSKKNQCETNAQMQLILLVCGAICKRWADEFPRTPESAESHNADWTLIELEE